MTVDVRRGTSCSDHDIGLALITKKVRGDFAISRGRGSTLALATSHFRVNGRKKAIRIRMGTGVAFRIRVPRISHD